MVTSVSGMPNREKEMHAIRPRRVTGTGLPYPIVETSYRNRWGTIKAPPGGKGMDSAFIIAKIVSRMAPLDSKFSSFSCKLARTVTEKNTAVEKVLRVGKRRITLSF